MFPSVEMVLTLNLYCTQFGLLVDKKREPRRKAKSLDTFGQSDTIGSSGRRRRNSWEPLDNRNNEFDKVLSERKHQPNIDHIVSNIVSYIIAECFAIEFFL